MASLKEFRTIWFNTGKPRWRCTSQQGSHVPCVYTLWGRVLINYNRNRPRITKTERVKSEWDLRLRLGTIWDSRPKFRKSGMLTKDPFTKWLTIWGWLPAGKDRLSSYFPGNEPDDITWLCRTRQKEWQRAIKFLFGGV